MCCRERLDGLLYQWCPLKPTFLLELVLRPSPPGSTLSQPLSLRAHLLYFLGIQPHCLPSPLVPGVPSPLSIYYQLCTYNNPKHSLTQHGVPMSVEPMSFSSALSSLLEVKRDPITPVAPMPSPRLSTSKSQSDTNNYLYIGSWFPSNVARACFSPLMIKEKHMLKMFPTSSLFLLAPSLQTK